MRSGSSSGSGNSAFSLTDLSAASSTGGRRADPRRRAGLFDALEALPGQVWMTGADPVLFGELGGRADMVQVADGSVRA